MSNLFPPIEPITPRQAETIKRIEFVLNIQFNGHTKQDATEFISVHLSDSIAKGNGPVSAVQAEHISFIIETLKGRHLQLVGNTYEEAKRFIEKYHDLAKKVHNEQKELRHLKKELENDVCRCDNCGTPIDALRSFINFLKMTKLCPTCYSEWTMSEEYREWEAARTKPKGYREWEAARTKPKEDDSLISPLKTSETPKPRKSKQSVKQNPTKPKKEGNKMFNNFKSVLGEFGKVTDGQFKLSFQGLAVRTGDDSYAVYDAEEHRMIDVMDFVADAEGMVYKMPTQINQLQQGDIIIAKNKPLIVKSVNGNSIRALNPVSNNETTHKPAGNLFGIQFITKVVSLFEMMQGQAGTAQGFNPMMLMMLSGKESDGKMEELLPLMLMGGMQGGSNPMQSMLPLMMLSGKGGDSSMMEMLMMSQLFGGQQGGFTLGNMFGGQAPKPAPKVESANDLVEQIIAELERRRGTAYAKEAQNNEPDLPL